eukprot:11316010-Prorocentrum_lima.AAC.1
MAVSSEAVTTRWMFMFLLLLSLMNYCPNPRLHGVRPLFHDVHPSLGAHVLPVVLFMQHSQ